ncbi:hypothetical protein C0992_004928 [Termitomyces sp. T32_za158]|nr:hypothetical protein C0992_004928 [Termitomyces sp. T32_za158]
MAPPQWTTNKQKEFLEYHKDKFLHYQAQTLLHKFWPYIENKWFQKWPAILNNEDELSPEEQTLKLGSVIEVKKKQLKIWYENISQALKGVTKSKDISLNFNPKNTCHRQVTKLYASKYYDDKIKPLVNKELNAMDHPCYTIGVIKQNIKKAWEAESEEVRRDVMEQFNLDANTGVQPSMNAAASLSLVCTPQE